MTQQVWTVERGTTNVTSQIQSLEYATGRQTQFDSWSPGSLVFTIRNDAGQANEYDLNNKITLAATGSSFSQFFYVQEILYNDLPGVGAGSIATIVCTDLLGRMGRIQVFEQSLTSEGTVVQLYNQFNSFMPTGTTIEVLGDGDSVATADASYSGTILNRLNLNMLTEQGLVQQDANTVYLFARSRIDDVAPGVITFARDVSGSFQMGYSDIKRIALGQNYLNTCTVTPPVAAAQNVSSTDGLYAYGTYGAEFSTVDDTATQALLFAQWQVYSRSDPDVLSFQISVSDAVNDLTELFVAISSQILVVTVSYKNPGDAATYTSEQVIQGWSMSVTPAATFMEIFTSPLTYTDFFTLDSATFGILGGSAVPYNNAVAYNAVGFSYNDATATLGSRLGW